MSIIYEYSHANISNSEINYIKNTPILVCQFLHETSYHMIYNENIHFCTFSNLSDLLTPLSAYFCTMILICSTFSQTAHIPTIMIANLSLIYFFLCYTLQMKIILSFLSKLLHGENYRFGIFSKCFDLQCYKRIYDYGGVCLVNSCRKMLIKTLRGLASMGL